MQTHHVDASQYYYSLDDGYYYGGMGYKYARAIYPHKPRSSSEIDLMVGDLLFPGGNKKNGTSEGRELRTGRFGQYLSYKVKEILRIEDFPTYKEVSNL